MHGMFWAFLKKAKMSHFKRVTLIITEKMPVASAVCRALCGHKCKDGDRCDCFNADVFVVSRALARGDSLKLRCIAYRQGASAESYFCQKGKPCAKCNTAAVFLTNKPGIGHTYYRKSRVLTHRLRHRKDARVETLKYLAVIPSKEDLSPTIVCATNGMPWQMVLRNTESQEYSAKPSIKSVHGQAKGSDNILDRLHVPKEAALANVSILTYPNRKAVILCRFLKSVILRRRLKGWGWDNLRLLIATDSDEAGAFIGLGARQYCFGNRKLPPWLEWGRIYLHDLNPESIHDAMQDVKDPDWGVGYAGMLRGTVDAAVGYATRVITQSYSELAKVLDPPEVGKKPPGIGRVKSLALKTLAARDEQIKYAATVRQLYLIISEIPFKARIAEAIRKGHFRVVLISKRPSWYSQGSFLRALRSHNVGTHTTRQGLPAALVKDDVAAWADLSRERIRTTPFGRAFLHALMSATRFGDSTLLEQLNRDVHASMYLLASMDCLSISDAIKAWNAQKSVSLSKVQEILFNILAFSRPLCANLLEGNFAKTIETKFQNSSMEMPKLSGDQIFGWSAPAPRQTLVEAIKKLNSNDSTISNTSFKITRIIRPTNRFDFKLRRLLNIDNSTDFKVVSGLDTVDFVDHLDIANFSLFSATLDASGDFEAKKELDRISDALNKGIFDIVSDSWPLQIEKTESVEPHDPITMRGIRPAEIGGLHGRLTAQEVLHPYLWNGYRCEAAMEGEIYLQSILVGSLCFDRSDHYRPGHVHSYEDILAAMSDWYGYGIRETADILQQMYSGPDS